MLKIAFLLLGPGAFRAQAGLVTLSGMMVLALAGAVAWDSLDGQARISHAVFGALFLAIALFHLIPVITAPNGAERGQRLLRLGLPLAVAGLLLASPVLSPDRILSFDADRVSSLILATALIIDGAIRLGIALVVRIPHWRRSALIGVAQLAGAAALIASWPLPQAGAVIFALALALALAGLTLVRLGLHLRGLKDGQSILGARLYSNRDWHKHAPTLTGDDPARAPDLPPLILYNWTPSGAPNVRLRLPIIDRYFAVPDSDGGMSSGHVSLALGSDFYISYYPVEEIERSSTNFINTMSGQPSHDMEGSFVPSFAFEVEDWRAPNRQFLLRRFSERRLRAYWDDFRRDRTYSLVNRNCAVAVGPALEAAMEGVWAGPKPWLRLARLMIDPGLWLAALIRARADFLTWTPGFVVDYMGELNRVMDQCDLGWSLRPAWSPAPSMICQDFPAMGPPIYDEA